MLKLLRLTVLILLGWGGFAHAAQVSDLYSSRLLVAQQSSQPTAEQARKGLSQVLVKVAGNRKILSYPAVLNRLKQSANALAGFGYQDAQRTISGAGGSQQPASILTMQFAPSIVNRIIADTGTRPMGSIRPSVLVWVAKQESGRRDYVSPESDIYQTFNFSADKRGLPLRVPLLDLTDQNSLSVGDLWGQFDGIIQSASQRYRTEAILAVRMTRTRNGQWQLDWQLLNGEQSQSGSHRGSLASVSETMINGVSDNLFATLTATPAAQEQVSTIITEKRSDGVTLAISGISNIAHAIELEDSLRNMPVIRSVKVAEIRGTKISYKLKLNGPLAQVRSALALLPRLRELPATVVNGEASSDLAYGWQ
ncbi:MAG: DUF2066 domain-containing protein [Pontibacterium sp.]